MLSELSGEQLRKLRNMVFAKYGYKFKSRDLQAYFSQFQWYSPQSRNVDDLLTSADSQLIEYILFLEWKAEYRQMPDEYFINNLVGSWHSRQAGQELLEQSIYSISSKYVFRPDMTYVYESQTDHMSGSATDRYEGEWKVENQKIYLMEKRYDSSSIEMHAEAEPQESEGTVPNTKWIEIGEFSTYSPPLRERENATILLKGDLHKKN
jgi:hypothetical protein